MIRIYRYGNYINETKSNASLERWLKDNLPPGKEETLDGMDLPKLLLLAGQAHYTFKRNKR